MRWLDLLVAGVAPKYAIRRVQARQGIRAFYEAAQATRLRKRRSDRRSPDETTRNAVESLRIQARHLEQNHDIARGALNIMVDNTVGTGIRPEPQVRREGDDGELASEVNEQLLDLWRDWIRTPEVTRDFDYYGAQRIVARHMYRDGECFAQILAGNVPRLEHGTTVPLSLELIEADYVPLDHEDEGKGIVQGVQKNAWGAPRFYFVHKEHPGGRAASMNSDLKRIAADRMIHVKLVDRIRQTRGVSVFASVISRLDDVKEIEESERVAARVAAAMTGFIKKGDPELYVAPASDADRTQDDYREMEFAPGMIFDDLLPGEDIGTIASNRPNNALVEFRASQLRAAAGGIGISYSSLAKDYNGTYSAQRQELVEQHTHYGVLWAYFADRFCQPVWQQFIEMCRLRNLVDFRGTDESTWYDCDHSRPVLPWIDPAKEMAGIEKELQLELTSRSAVIRRRGGNPEQVRKQIEQERRDSPPPSTTE